MLHFRANALDASKDIQVTTDGVNDTVFNGIPDHVYEESVLSVNYALYINPSGSIIAFAKINDTSVPIFQYPIYGHPESLNAGRYPIYK